MRAMEKIFMRARMQCTECDALRWCGRMMRCADKCARRRRGGLLHGAHSRAHSASSSCIDCVVVFTGNSAFAKGDHKGAIAAFTEALTHDPNSVALLSNRSAAYAARWVAKNVVAAGAAARCEVQVAYAIGMAHPVSIFVETFGTETVDPAAIDAAVREVFDLRPGAIVRDLELRRPVFREPAAYGHFGREGDGFTWEHTSRAADLRSQLGL